MASVSHFGKSHDSIALYLDFICPWSYIGWHNFCQALDEVPAHYLPPEVIPRSHELNSNMPPEHVMSFENYMRHKFSDHSSIAEWQEVVIQAAAESGLDIDFQKFRHVFCTRLLHRMMHVLKGSAQLRVFMDKAFHQVIVRGEMLNSPERIKQATGFDYHQLMRHKSEQECDHWIERDLWHGNHAGVTGIPCYTFGKHYTLFGAQSVKGYRAMLDLLQETSMPNMQADSTAMTITTRS